MTPDELKKGFYVLLNETLKKEFTKKAIDLDIKQADLATILFEQFLNEMDTEEGFLHWKQKISKFLDKT